ncbi:hypothetical protein GCM10010435_82370 [Winogradskya consettensis]|uniref:Uncharacterized protein n=1 Tax=Winogradskya consettensis TaxID=113560 RepID=A0A919SW70_9ACTN|nr:hypothetical protein [Actinoplanes consettensis]GIM79124.1 hypothetical protein Aco04nite_63950 [Actinoplanes consettensis]
MRRPGRQATDARDPAAGLLRSITQFTVDLLPAVSYASMTTHREDGYVTVAMSSELALAVDEAQYLRRRAVPRRVVDRRADRRAANPRGMAPLSAPVTAAFESSEEEGAGPGGRSAQRVTARTKAARSTT